MFKILPELQTEMYKEIENGLTKEIYTILSHELLGEIANKLEILELISVLLKVRFGVAREEIDYV